MHAGVFPSSEYVAGLAGSELEFEQRYGQTASSGSGWMTSFHAERTCGTGEKNNVVLFEQPVFR
jgi:hypothetical protein